MRIVNKTEVVKIEEKLLNILCNQCGESCDPTKQCGPFGYCGLVEAQTTHGYGSDFDGERFRFSLCEKCVFEMILTFKIEPEFISGFAATDDYEKDKAEAFERIKNYCVKKMK